MHNVGALISSGSTSFRSVQRESSSATPEKSTVSGPQVAWSSDSVRRWSHSLYAMRSRASSVLR